MKVVVTGGSGKVGRAVLRELLEHGHEVLNVDRNPPDRSAPPAPFLPADLTDYGQTLEALSGAELMSGTEAVVHLAAIPSPIHATPDVVFATNIRSTYTVFSAAVRLRLQRVVWASSETTLGTPFPQPPDYTPVDERHPLRPESSYALSKVLGEEMARQFSRWSAIPFIGLRFSNVMERADYAQFPSWWDDPRIRSWNLWSYVDVYDLADAIKYSGSKSAQLHGPGWERVNMSLFKNFKTLRSEYVQFRADAFNLFNTPSNGQPSSPSLGSTAGLITNTQAFQNYTPDARFFQLAAKYVF